MYAKIDVKLNDIPLRFDLNVMQSLENALGVKWQTKIYEYDYDVLTNIIITLMKEGLRYYAFMGGVKEYEEPTKEATYLLLSGYKRKEICRLILSLVQISTMTEEEVKRALERIELEEDQIQPVRGVEEKDKGTDYYYYYYFAQKEFNLSREEAGFLLLVEWKGLYRAYQDKFDTELCLRLNRKTYGMVRRENNMTLNDEINGYDQL